MCASSTGGDARIRPPAISSLISWDGRMPVVREADSSAVKSGKRATSVLDILYLPSGRNSAAGWKCSQSTDEAVPCQAPENCQTAEKPETTDAPSALRSQC